MGATAAEMCSEHDEFKSWLVHWGFGIEGGRLVHWSRRMVRVRIWVAEMCTHTITEEHDWLATMMR